MNDVINIIRKIVLSYTRSTGENFDDLYSEACLAYLEAAASYDPKKGKKSTYLWKVVTNRINSNLKAAAKRHEFPYDAQDIGKLCQEDYIDPEQIVIAKECWSALTESFSPEAQEICAMITRREVELDVNKPREARGKIAKELRKRGWSHPKIWAAFREIKLSLRKP